MSEYKSDIHRWGQTKPVNLVSEFLTVCIHFIYVLLLKTKLFPP